MKSIICELGAANPSNNFVVFGGGSLSDSSDASGIRVSTSNHVARFAVTIPELPADFPGAITQVCIRAREGRLFTQTNGCVYEVYVNGQLIQGQAEFLQAGDAAWREHLVLVSGDAIALADLATLEVGFRNGGWNAGDRWEIYEVIVELGWVPDQLQTWSALTRASSLAEALYRAQQNDVLFGQGDNWADQIRDAFPGARIITYNQYRLATSGTISDAQHGWLKHCTDNAIDPEPAFLHRPGGARAQEGQLGWYVMNVTYLPWLAWQNANMAKLLIGERFGIPAQFTAPPSIYGAIFDNTLLWTNYDDVNHENIQNTIEYPGPGGPDQYLADCALSFLQCQPGVDAIAGRATGTMIANLGNVGESLRTDPATVAVLAAARRMLCLEHFCRWQANGEPELAAEFFEQRFAKFAELLDGTREIVIESSVAKSESQSVRDRAKIGVAVASLLAFKPGLISRFYLSPEDAPEPIAEWEQNELMRQAAASLGAPLGPYSIVTPAGWTKARVYTRSFSAGRVYLSVRKAGQTGSEPAASITIGQQMLPIAADGQAGAAVSSISLTMGEGAILLAASPIELAAPIDEVIELEAPIDEVIEVYAPIEE